MLYADLFLECELPKLLAEHFAPGGSSMRLRAVSTFLVVCLASIGPLAQNLALQAPERIVVRSNVLNEDRPILVRLPAGAQAAKVRYPVLYMTDGDGHMEEVGGIIDFLVAHNRCSPMILVGIPNTDRTRDLTPTRADAKSPEGKVVQTFPTSGGADRFL